MTLILNLPPEAEAQLKAAADAAGQDVNTYAVSVVLRGIQSDTADYDYDDEAVAEVVAAYHAGVAEVAAGGRHYTAGDLTTGLQEALAARRRQKVNQPGA